MSETSQPTARIRINRSQGMNGKKGFDATLEIFLPLSIPQDPSTVEADQDLNTAILQDLRRTALFESDMLIAELEQRVNGAEVPAADAE